MEQIKYDVFVSYSRKDYVDEMGNIRLDSEVAKILEDLKKANISFWFDRKGILHGDDFGEKILKYIKAAKIFVYLSTVEANQSIFTRKEIACASMYNKKIIPVRIDESPFHDSVMFRIVDLDHINYYLNPKNGREELIDSIKRYLAEEAADAARREEEERRRREEQDLQRRQQESLRLKQQQAENLRAEISKTEKDCSVLETDLLQKKSAFEVVNAELKSKLKHLEEQKQKMNALLHDEDENSKDLNDQLQVPLDIQSEDSGFQFHWLHPLNSLREMWKKMKETAAMRHWTVTLLLSVYLVAAFSIFLVAVVYSEFWSIAICFLALFIIYAILQLMVNKRSGIGFLLLSPIMILLIAYFTRDDLYRRLLSYLGNEEFPIIIILLSCIAILFVLPIFLIRKNRKRAWSLLEGKVYQALQINKHPAYYLLYVLGLLLAFLSFENNIAYCGRVFQEKEKQVDSLKEELNRAMAILKEPNSLNGLFYDTDAYRLYSLGDHYYDEGVYEKAIPLYLIALGQGLERDYEKWAQYNLGKCYENGWGVTPDTIKAIDFYEKAYSGGNYVSDALNRKNRLKNAKK